METGYIGSLGIVFAMEKENVDVNSDLQPKVVTVFSMANESCKHVELDQTPVVLSRREIIGMGGKWLLS